MTTLIRKKIPKISVSPDFKKKLYDCCTKLAKGTFQSADEAGAAEEWTNLLDRGGLCHVRDTTFQLMCSLEREFRTQLHTLDSTTAAMKDTIIKKLVSSNDTHFYWCIATAEFDKSDAEVENCLLHMIVELFLYARLFTCKCMD